MKTKTLILPLILGIMIAPTGFAQGAAGEVSSNCPAPTAPSIPDGRNSSEAEMIDAQGNMKSFIADGNAYLECLARLEKKWGNGASNDQKTLVVTLHNKMVDEMNTVADLFNAAVRAFKGRN